MENICICTLLALIGDCPRRIKKKVNSLHVLPHFPQNLCQISSKFRLQTNIHPSKLRIYKIICNKFATVNLKNIKTRQNVS